MVRLSDILHWDTPAPAAAQLRRTEIGTADSMPPPQSAAVQAPAMQRPSAAALYDRLVSETLACFEGIEDGQPLLLGRLPELAGALVDRMDAGEDWISLALTRDEARFSVARHSVNVAILLVRMGQELDFPRSSLLEFALLGLLHDSGMAPLRPLWDRKAELEADERAEMERHPLISKTLLQQNRDLPRFIGEIAAMEHERNDGSGYPNRLAGRDLADHGHVLGLVDMYEALTHERPFRRRLSSAQALRAIVHRHRRNFRLDIMRQFLNIVPAFPLGSSVCLSDGSYARVETLHRNALFSPTVRLYRQAPEGPVLSDELRDLRRERDLHILDAVDAPKED